MICPATGGEAVETTCRHLTGLGVKKCSVCRKTKSKGVRLGAKAKTLDFVLGESEKPTEGD